MLCLVFFAFTTILGWDYYSERCLEYLTGGNMKAVKVYRWLYILAVFIGPYMTVEAVWTIADIFNGLMAVSYTHLEYEKILYNTTRNIVE